MNITFQTINFKADQKLKKFITEKINKLDQFYDHIVDAIIYLKVENTTDKRNKVIELKLNVSNSTLFVVEKNTSFESSCDSAIDSMRNQLLKFKGKLQS